MSRRRSSLSDSRGPFDGGPSTCRGKDEAPGYPKSTVVFGLRCSRLQQVLVVHLDRLQSRLDDAVIRRTVCEVRRIVDPIGRCCYSAAAACLKVTCFRVSGHALGAMPVKETLRTVLLPFQQEKLISMY